MSPSEASRVCLFRCPSFVAGSFFRSIRIMDSVIWNILVHHPEAEWLDRCQEALPQVSEGEILSVIQLYFCDDVEILLED